MIAPKDLTSDFKQVAALAGIVLQEADLIADVLPAPHSPPASLGADNMAVYCFFWRDECLKVGKVGPKSQARYTSQHYLPNSSMSNLAKSILKEQRRMGLENLNESTVGDWIKQETTRVNFILNSSVGVSALNLLEAFLQCRLIPKFEGFSSQRSS